MSNVTGLLSLSLTHLFCVILPDPLVDVGEHEPVSWQWTAKRERERVRKEIEMIIHQPGREGEGRMSDTEREREEVSLGHKFQERGREKVPPTDGKRDFNCSYEMGTIYLELNRTHPVKLANSSPLWAFLVLFYLETSRLCSPFSGLNVRLCVCPRGFIVSGNLPPSAFKTG